MKYTIVTYLLALLVVTIPGISNASVVYTFEAFLDPYTNVAGSFTYTSPDFITTNQQVDASALDTCEVTTPAGGSCASMEFYADISPLTNPPADTYDAIMFGYGDPNSFGYQIYGITSSVYYYFENGALGKVGTYYTSTTTPAPGRLTVSLTPVPLPTSLWLFGSGLLGPICFARRKKA